MFLLTGIVSRQSIDDISKFGTEQAECRSTADSVKSLVTFITTFRLVDISKCTELF